MKSPVVRISESTFSIISLSTLKKEKINIIGQPLIHEKTENAVIQKLHVLFGRNSCRVNDCLRSRLTHNVFKPETGRADKERFTLHAKHFGR